MVIWKPIEGFEGLYEVSNQGEVKSLARENYYPDGRLHQRKKEKILSTRPDKRGYVTVILCKNGKTYPRGVHRLVAEAFIPNPEQKPNIDHIDTNPWNNCVDNLRWVTQQENAMNPLTRQHVSKSKIGHKYWGRPLTEEERAKISQALKGRKLTAEHRKKLSESHKGKKPSFNSKGKHWKIEGGKRVWYSTTDSN